MQKDYKHIYLVSHGYHYEDSRIVTASLEYQTAIDFCYQYVMTLQNKENEFKKQCMLENNSKFDEESFAKWEKVIDKDLWATEGEYVKINKKDLI
jgi:hypothetical protein